MKREKNQTKKDEDAIQKHEDHEACGAWHETQEPEIFLPEMLDLVGQPVRVSNFESPYDPVLSKV